MIKFKHEVQLEVVETFNEVTEAMETFQEVFGKDETVAADVVSDTADRSDIQFGDGSVAHGVPNEYFEVV